MVKCPECGSRSARWFEQIGANTYKCIRPTREKEEKVLCRQCNGKGCVTCDGHGHEMDICGVTVNG